VGPLAVRLGGGGFTLVEHPFDDGGRHRDPGRTPRYLLSSEFDGRPLERHGTPVEGEIAYGFPEGKPAQRPSRTTNRSV
jgi:hypothetical protein